MLIFLWIMAGLSMLWVGFTYLGYPVVLAVLARWDPRPVRREPCAPSLSVIIAVHNGENELPGKLANTLASDYPGKLQIIVASDHSTDQTEEIARSYSDPQVVLTQNRGARGKESAQAAGLKEARGDVIVFTDVSAELSRDALSCIVKPFADPLVGAVSSEDEVDSDGGEGAYVRYEMALRRLENLCGGLIGLSGSFFAIRRCLCDNWATDLASDFRSALETARQGYRAVSEPTAKASFKAVEDAAAEWPRKVRTVRRGIAVLAAYRELLSPRYGRVALSLWGHKVMRFTSPVALLILLGSALFGALNSPSLAWLLGAQLIFYAMGMLALASPRIQRSLVPRLAGFFILVNASMLVAWMYHLSGRRSVQWKPTQR